MANKPNLKDTIVISTYDNNWCWCVYFDGKYYGHLGYEKKKPENEKIYKEFVECTTSELQKKYPGYTIIKCIDGCIVIIDKQQEKEER